MGLLNHVVYHLQAKKNLICCNMAAAKQLIIDCDPGNDDAMAILMALNSTAVDVKAITCVEGNTNVMQTGRNALRTLKVANRLNVSKIIIEPVHVVSNNVAF